jgi:hypothetical protein
LGLLCLGSLSLAIERPPWQAVPRPPADPTSPFGWQLSDAILAQEPQAAPETLKKSPAPLFHAASRKIRRELYDAYRHFLVAFRDAAARLRAGDPEVVFPAGSFPPAAPWVAG